MIDFGFFRLLAREVVGPRVLSRSVGQLEALSPEEMVAAMQGGGAVTGPTAAGYLYQTSQICRTIRGCGLVVDLGCGTGVQLMQVAELNPAIHFVGVDWSAPMLDAARADMASKGLENVSFLCADCRDLSTLPPQCADGVISTMALHHAHDHVELAAWIGQIGRVLRPGGSVYIEDFGRLKAQQSIAYFLSRAGAGELSGFKRLYEASLRAAFTRQELIAEFRAGLPAAVSVFSTRPVPFLVVAKTADRGLAPDQRELLTSQWFDAMSPMQQTDYRELALAFKMGGLPEPMLTS